jgi:hypothetical protein
MSSRPASRGAGLQPAVSPICNRQAVGTAGGLADGSQVANLRYSRLQTCATPLAGVRPSSGAASLLWSSSSDRCDVIPPSRISAAEDGRTPPRGEAGAGNSSCAERWQARSMVGQQTAERLPGPFSHCTPGYPKCSPPAALGESPLMNTNRSARGSPEPQQLCRAEGAQNLRSLPGRAGHTLRLWRAARRPSKVTGPRRATP